MRIFVTTSDDYTGIVPEMVERLLKHWPEQDITILGFNLDGLELPAGVKKVSLGMQATFGRSWTDPLIPFFSELEDDRFILMLDDYYMTHDVNPEVMEMAYRAFDHYEMDKLDLSGDRVKFRYTPVDDFLIESIQSAPYRTSLQAAIWKKDYFLKYLKPARTAWGFELQGYREAFGDGGKVFGTRVPLLRYDNVMLKGEGKETWDDNAKSLKWMLENKPIEGFKGWDVVKKAMIVGNEKWIDVERKVIEDGGWLEYCDDNTEIHQAYHLESNAKSINHIRGVIEIGGGYGAMAKVCLSAWPHEHYTIFDIPESCELQKYFLSGYKDIQWNPAEINPEGSLGLAMWSLSELPLDKRGRYIELLKGCKSYIIAFQKKFDGIDNVKYFRDNLGGDVREIKHLPGSYYMVKS